MYTIHYLPIMISPFQFILSYTFAWCYICSMCTTATTDHSKTVNTFTEIPPPPPPPDHPGCETARSNRVNCLMFTSLQNVKFYRLWTAISTYSCLTKELSALLWHITVLLRHITTLIRHITVLLQKLTFLLDGPRASKRYIMFGIQILGWKCPEI